MTAFPKSAVDIKGSAEDDRLVQECLRGSQEAWSTLVDKYKNLIFSIPLKQGFPPEDAADIFQGVCLAVLQELPRLREPRALAAWLIQTTSHKCFRWRGEQKWRVNVELPEIVSDETVEMPEEFLREIEREQILRESLATLTPDCRQLIQLLFLEDPPASYDEIAKQVGMAKGSIGATRMRCLEKLHRSLERKGFRSRI